MTDPASTEIPAKKAAKKTTAKKAAVKKTTAKKAPAKKAAKKTTAKKAAKKATTSSAQSELPLTPAPAKEPAPVKVKADPEPKGEPKAAPPADSAPTTSEPSQKIGRVDGGGRISRRSPRKSEQNSDSQPDQREPRNREPREPRERRGPKPTQHGDRRERNDQDSERRGRNRNRRNRNNRNRNRDRGSENEDDYVPRTAVLEGPEVACEGMLELAPKGFGFLRVPEKDYEQDRADVFVTPDFVRRYGLRQGVWIKGVSRTGQKGPQLSELTLINETEPEEMKKLPHFEELRAVNPTRRISFETTSERATTRVMDVVAPIGRGQRGLIVSPPRSGKTTLLLHTAEALIEKYDEQIHLIILLVDERPEEVTEFKRSLPGAEIYASSNDQSARNHCRMAELCIERAKRLVEQGKDVFILMDSITRLARAYNSAAGGSKQGKGRGYQSGGIVAGALEMPRRIFAAARDTRTAGSLTILATALVQTNSKADELIFQEFKGTGNMELVLDRRIAEQYLYPAVDIFKSGTRREELLLPEHMLHKIHLIRRGLAGHKPAEAVERLLFFIKRFPNNNQMLLEIKG